MQRLLVFVSVSLLSAGISHAQEPPTESLTILTAAMLKLTDCKFDIDKSSLDAGHHFVATLPKDEKDRDTVLKALTKRGPRYDWVIEALSKKVKVEPTSENSRRIGAIIDKTLYYDLVKVNVFQLHELKFVLDQILSGDEWMPQQADMEIHYVRRRRIFPLAWKEVHERYAIGFKCSTRATK